MWQTALILVLCGATAAPAAENAPASGDPPSNKVLAVLPAEHRGQFEELTAVEDSLGDLLSVLLADNKTVTVVERVHLRKLLREKKLALAGITEIPRATEVGQLLKADYIVTSTIEAAENELEVRCNLIEVTGARIVHTVHQKGQLEDFMSVLQRCAQGITEGLDITIADLHPEELDRSPRLSLLFMRGLSFYHEGLPDRAQVEFMKIIALDPMHEDARAFSAKCYYQAGELEHARIEAEWFLENFPESHYRAELEPMAAAPPQTNGASESRP
jgi:TolB-like protein